MKRIKQSNPHIGKRGMRRGAVLVEAAMATLFILLPLLIGIVQFGLFYNATNTVTQAAREGARYAAVYGMRTDLTDAYIKNHVIDVGKQSGLILDPTKITLTSDPTTRTQYGIITVTVQYDLKSRTLLPKVYNPGVVTRAASSILE